jgi:uncharacterized HAD superfamily protein
VNIGIDVDGVLTDYNKYLLEKGVPYFRKKFKRDDVVISVDSYYISDIFGCSQKIAKNFWKRNMWEYCRRYPIRENASEVIDRFRNENHKVFLITSRVYTKKNNIIGWLSRHVLKTWLKKSVINYDDIAFCADEFDWVDKGLACKRFRVDVMVEDKPENVYELSKTVKVLCYSASYNKDCIGSNIVQVESFEEIYHYIESLNA